MLHQKDKLKMYFTMLCIRRFEEKAEELYMAGKIWGTFHLYIGEEAVATGACFALRPDDYIPPHIGDTAIASPRGPM